LKFGREENKAQVEEIYLRAVVDLEEGHAQDTIFEVNIEDAVSVALMNWIPASASSTDNRAWRARLIFIVSFTWRSGATVAFVKNV
jgi:hypothetical protein